MRRVLQSGQLYQTEYDQICALSKQSGWNPTEVTSFFIRWSLNRYDARDINQFNQDLAKELVESFHRERMKTPEGKQELKAAIKKRIKDLGLKYE